MAKKHSSRSVPAKTAGKPHPTDDDIIKSLAGLSNKVSDEDLNALFGDDVHELRRLAALRFRASRRRGPVEKVYLLHGIMGSELGRSRLLWDDVIWLGLSDILFGNLKLLALNKDPKIKALGFLPGVYLMMRLELEGAGYEVVEHFYDWRQKIGLLGAELKKRVEAEPRPVRIVAHSMGGLVTRAAFQQGMANVTKFIMLATPNHGSLAPVEAFRGQYALARMISNMDFANSSDELAQQVFSTFPGLYEMILWRSVHPSLDLFNLDNWPQSGPRPDPQLLALATTVETRLAVPGDTPDIPWYLIAGVDQETKVEARAEAKEFSYRITNEGDGTVPLDSALLSGVQKTWFASAGHGFFANNGGVRAATIDILGSGDTTQLPTTRPAASRAVHWVKESELKQVAATRRSTRGAQPFTHPERLRAIFGKPEPFTPPTDEPTDSAGYAHKLEQVTIGRKKLRRLEVQFYLGSITDVNARAYVLGTFSGVTPSGAAGALDVLMDGAIADLIGHNMFGSRTGEVFMLPLARREVRAEVGVFVGMGEYDRFKIAASPPPGGRGPQAYLHRTYVPALEIAAEHGARMLARTNVDDFATVLLGGTVAGDMAASGESMLRGFLRGLEEADPGEGVRRIVICEMDGDRYRAIRQHLVYLATTPLCEGIEFVLSDMEPPPDVRRLRALGVSPSTARSGAPEPAYLLVRAEDDVKVKDLQLWKFALLGPSSHAAVREGTTSITKPKFDALLSPVANAQSPTTTAASKLGQDIVSTLLPSEIQADLVDLSHMPLVVLHDPAASCVPWETLEFVRSGPKTTAWQPALAEGMTRRFLTTTSACSRWSNAATLDAGIRVLLVSNPTGDLPGAAKEAATIATLLSGNSRFKLDNTLSGASATKKAVLDKLSTGLFDICHFSSHAFFDDNDRDGCGIVCANSEVLTGRELAGLPKLPFLMMVNACQSMRIRSQPLPKPKVKTSPARTIAETMLCSGIGNYVGTYWPVDDSSAGQFAATFYGSLLNGKSLGEALLLGRKQIQPAQAQNDWANYVLFGNPAADLKTT